MPVAIEQITSPVSGLGRLHRCVEVAREAVNQEARTVQIAVSSEEPCARWFGFEILDHGRNSVSMDRMRNRAPLLLGHDPDRQIGVVERAWLEDRRLKAEVRFSRSPEADIVFKDIVDGIRSKISVGYQVNAAVLEKTEGNDDTYRVTSWEPMEVSVVSVPADDSVGVGRELTTVSNMNPPVNTPALPVNVTRTGDPTPAPAALPPTSPPPQVTVVLSEDQRRIALYGQAWPAHAEAAQRAFADGRTFAQFMESISNPTRGTAPAAPPARQVDPNIGMSPTDVRRFSVLRAMASIAFEGGLSGLEREASDAFAQRFGLKTNDRSFFIPWDVQRSFISATRADLAAGTGNLGGVTIQTDVLGSELIELLRARLLTNMLGVRTMFGLQGNVSIPAVTAGATGAWLAEAAPIVPSNQTFGQVPLSPKRYGAATAYSRQLVVQSTIDVEAFVRDDLAQTVARAFDLAVIAGSGAGGQPTGILSTAGIGTVTFGGAATWAKVLEFETAVANANADFGNLAYLSTPATRGKWKNIPKTPTTNTGGYLWQDSGFIPVIPPAGSAPTAGSPPIGVVNGYRAVASTIVPTNRVIYGNWSDAILAMWIPLEVVVDPYSLSLNHQVRVVVNALGDVGVRHAASFCASTDTGAA
jgi:HK97 family phage major capsid protein/HK97 family phage prohead protease